MENSTNMWQIRENCLLIGSAFPESPSSWFWAGSNVRQISGNLSKSGFGVDCPPGFGILSGEDRHEKVFT
jgi:hypothetical protein